MMHVVALVELVRIPSTALKTTNVSPSNAPLLVMMECVALMDVAGKMKYIRSYAHYLTSTKTLRKLYQWKTLQFRLWIL